MSTALACGQAPFTSLRLEQLLLCCPSIVLEQRMLSHISSASRLFKLKAQFPGTFSPLLACTCGGASLRCYLPSLRVFKTCAQRHQAMATSSQAETATEALNAQADLYGGVIVDASTLPSDAGDFERRLQQSLKVCAAEGLEI